MSPVAIGWAAHGGTAFPMRSSFGAVPVPVQVNPSARINQTLQDSEPPKSSMDTAVSRRGVNYANQFGPNVDSPSANAHDRALGDTAARPPRHGRCFLQDEMLLNIPIDVRALRAAWFPFPLTVQISPCSRSTASTRNYQGFVAIMDVWGR